MEDVAPCESVRWVGGGSLGRTWEVGPALFAGFGFDVVNVRAQAPFLNGPYPFKIRLQPFPINSFCGTE
jgi:hypothetical protein